MKQLMAILTSVMSIMIVYAHPEMEETGLTCRQLRDSLDLPYHYCSCSEKSTVFAFPLETEINDTVWYTASLNDLLNGVSAYWFSDVAVTMDIYAFCTSKVPTYSLTVGPNQMRDMDMAQVQQKLKNMTDQQKLMAQTLTPHMRVYPHKKGSGKVYCYPYNQGPESTCDNPLPLRPGMTYICEKEENVYRMEWSSVPSSCKAFVRWFQKKNKPSELWLTLDSCNGLEIGRAQLSDSLHVYIPDSAALAAALNEKRSIWLHVKHDEGYVGRVFWYNNPKYTDQPSESLTKKTCEGKKITVNFMTFNSDTAFVDTLWVCNDTLAVQSVSLTFTQPPMEYDTIYASPTDLARGYRHSASGTIFHEYKDSTVTVIRENACTRLIHISVLPNNQAVEYVGAAKGNNYKYIQNGKLFILVDDKKYNVLGQQITK